jgi:hypothetical protein
MSSVLPNGPRPLSRSLAWHRDEILAHVYDPIAPFPRFNVVGDDGSGKLELLQAVADGCAGHGLLVLHVTAPGVAYAADDSAQDRELADLYACAELIGDFVTCIDTFAAEHPESQAATERAGASLKRSRSVQRLHNLATRGSRARTHQERLTVLREETELVLRSLSDDCKLAILIDDVDLLDHTSVPDWLHALLRRVPTLCTVITRRPGRGAPRPGHADDYRTIVLRNMTLDEVGAYLEDRHIAFTGEEARKLFDLTGGQEFAVAAWCDLALDAGVGGFTELMDGTGVAGDPGFTLLTERVQLAVDQIPVDILGHRMPLFALLAVAEVVTPRLIALLEDDTGQKPSERQAGEIYSKLVSRRFISVIGGHVERGAYLPRAVSEVARELLSEQNRVAFRDMHSYAELYQRELVDLEYELKERTPFAFWLRFENPDWVRGVERWLDHAIWLDREQFENMKPALVKIYLDAFWWWDDYLRSAATSILKPALRRVAEQQQDQAWMKALEGFSDHWVSSWDEAVLRADPRQWRLALDAIRRLFGMFDLHRGDVPRDLERRRIYILLCNFYGKAHWYAGEAGVRRAEEADLWLAAAQAACATQDGEADEDNPNGWIGSWALLRRAEVWSTLDPRRSRGYLHGLDRKAIEDEDNDLRVGIATLIGDLHWQSGEFKDALDVYSRALFISYTYNVLQETRRKAPNLYTKSLYEATIRRVEQRVAERAQANELELLDNALSAMRELFEVYWERVGDQPEPPAPLARFALPVPPPPKDSEISTLEEMDEAYALDNEYVAALLELAESQENTIIITNEKPLIDTRRGREGDGARIYEVHGSGSVIEAFYNQILQPSFPADELIDLDELQGIADRDDGAVWLAEDADGTILGGAVAEWDESARVVLLGYLAARPGSRRRGIGGPLYLAALDSWRQRFRPCLILAEIEDPAVHSGNNAYGDPADRLRFYVNRGSRVLDFPYFQPALDPDRGRVSGLLLIVLHADPEFAGADDDTIDASVVRKYLENYQIQYEGKVATDEQAMEMWRALDRPGGVRLREH